MMSLQVRNLTNAWKPRIRSQPSHSCFRRTMNAKGCHKGMSQIVRTSVWSTELRERPENRFARSKTKTYYPTIGSRAEKEVIQ